MGDFALLAPLLFPALFQLQVFVGAQTTTMSPGITLPVTTTHSPTPTPAPTTPSPVTPSTPSPTTAATTPSPTTPSPPSPTPAVTTPSPGFIDLPAAVDVSESVGSRGVVVEFQIQTADPRPNVQILSVTPAAAVFETPIINPTNVSNVFTVQIVLNGSLDYETASLYSVRLGLVTATGHVEQTFHVRLTDVNEPPKCEPQFQLPGAEVHVPENLAAPVQLYTVLARDPDENDILTFSISQVLPDSSRGQFHVDGRGSITSSLTFDFHAGPREFAVSVVVKDRQGANCSGTVRIKVLRVVDELLEFLLDSQNVSIFENRGNEHVVATVQADPAVPDVLYTFVRTYPPYKLGRGDGVIRTAFNLDLEADRTLARTVLLVRAFSAAEDRSGTATVTVHVLDVNEHPPFCSPLVLMLTVPETTEVGRSLGRVSCVDIDISNHNVSLTLIDNSLSLFKLRLKNGQLQVNSTLDYDTADIANNNFQYEATILATDTGTPPLTTEIQILITVTAVNEFDPEFVAPLELSVPENAQRGSVVGAVRATDRDWPFDSLRYSIPAGHALFSIDPAGGQLYLGAELDFEVQQTYTVRVQAVDFNQDVDRTNQRTGAVDITVRVQNMNDNPPVCDPVSYESTIFSTLAANVPILTISCTDIDKDALTATITHGAVVDRFQMNGMSLSSRNIFSYIPDGVYDATAFEVPIAVSDGKHSTTVVAYIHVVPWTTTVPPTTTTTTRGRPPQVVTVVSGFWDPEPWFVAVLTVTGALILLSLGLLTWAILVRSSVCGTRDKTESLLSENAGTPKTDHQAALNLNDRSSLDGSISLSKVSIQEDIMRFDGKAQDPVSGRSYLFNSSTGERRWL